MKQSEKFSREVRRIGKQARNVFQGVQSKAIGPIWNKVRDKYVVAHEGEQSIAPQLVLFLIFQPNGISRSTWVTLQHVVSRGFAPLIMCNGGAPDEDLERLQTIAWRVLTRPNLGYDFGGYQDAMWFLKTQGITPDRLLVMNDTVWMPALDGDRARSNLDDMLALPGDYTALCNFIYRPKSGRSDGLVRKTYPSSFCFALSSTMIRAPAFVAYWENLPLNGHKARVVEHGEVGFARAMMDAGFQPNALFDHAQIQEAVLGLPDNVQRTFINRLPVLKGAWIEQLDLIRRTSDETLAVTQRRAFLEDVLPLLNPWDSLAVNGLVSGEVDFIKKANIKNKETAQRFLAMADDAEVPLRAEVRDEIVAYAWQ